MKKKPASVMVAIADIDRSSLPLLKKAAAIARESKASLHLLHVIALPYGPMPRAGVSAKQAMSESIRDCELALKRLARIPQMRGVRHSVKAVWDYPAADAIVREVMRQHPALLIAESRRHSRLIRTVLTSTDWDLIRHCPCPVFLSKTDRWPAKRKVLAAIDPFHAHGKPAALDDRIIERAIELASSPSRVTAFHAHAALEALALQGLHEPYWPAMTPQETRAYEESIRKRVRAVAAKHEVPSSNVTCVMGDPALALPRAAKRLGADVVVMGAVSRSGLKRLFIGNTAERTLDHLDCDILIVKPRGFRSPVPRRAPPQLPYPPYPL